MASLREMQSEMVNNPVSLQELQECINTRYPVTSEMCKRLDSDYTYHPTKADQPERYVYLRTKARELAMTIVNLTPPSREQSVALTKLEEAIFAANAAIARHE